MRFTTPPDYNAEKPKYATEWSLQLTRKVLLPEALYSGSP